MQVTKKHFKSLLKECIKELLEEGAFNKTMSDIMTESIQEGKLAGRDVSAMDIIKSSKVPSYLSDLNEDTHTEYKPSYLSETQKQRQQNGGAKLDSRLSNIIREQAHGAAGGDKNKAALMEAIFADTALTTCVDQRHDSAAGSSINSMLPGESEQSKEQLRSETQIIESLAPDGDIGRWAKIAAMSYGKGK